MKITVDSLDIEIVREQYRYALQSRPGSGDMYYEGRASGLNSALRLLGLIDEREYLEAHKTIFPAAGKPEAASATQR